MLTEKEIELILHQAENILKYGLQYDRHYWIRSNIFERIPSGTGEGVPAISKEAAAATYIARRSTGADSSQRGDACDQSDVQAESLIEQLARSNGFWYDCTDRILRHKYGNPIAFGSEASVYLDIERNLVVKAIDMETYGSLLPALYRVVIHNSLFPEASLNVVGFGRSQFGLFEIVAEQPYIRGRYSTFEEIKAELIRLGAKEQGGDFVTDRYFISDIKPKNAIINGEGKIFVIDSYLEFLADTIKGLPSELPDRNIESQCEQISAESALFKSYARLHGKTTTYSRLLSLHSKLGDAIRQEAVDSPKYQELLKYMYEQIGKALSMITKNESIGTKVNDVDRYLEIGASGKLFVSATLLKRYIDIYYSIGINSDDMERQSQNLLCAVNKALENKQVEKQYADCVMAVKQNLEDDNIAPIPLDLSGFSGNYGLAGEIADEILKGCDGGQ